MSLAAELQPDQNPELWNNHVTVYEEVFEPLTNAFATHALDRLNVAPGDRLIDIGAGAGGAALIAAGRGGDVVAIDASPQMVARIVS
jgi:cyclopropane fatty-acyl-phospholipid synthase-like methyltransferase